MSHALLDDFKANKPSFGAWLMMPGFFHARAVAQSHPNLSWILVDCEHGLVSLIPGAAETVAAIHGGDGGGKSPSAIVRIPATDVSNSTSWQIKCALDSGARGVLVPMVGNAAKARQIVQDSRFPPMGRRGYGSPFVNGNWGVSPMEYQTNANDKILVMGQIESKEGVQNVEEIAQVDGIDALFIGPNDLSMGLGYPLPNPEPHPDVEKVIQDILAVCVKYSKKCGIFCGNGTLAAQRAKQGFAMINVTVDQVALQSGLKNEIDKAVE